MEIQKEGTLWLQKLKSKRLIIKLFKKHFSALNFVFVLVFHNKKEVPRGHTEEWGSGTMGFPERLVVSDPLGRIGGRDTLYTACVERQEGELICCLLRIGLR